MKLTNQYCNRQQAEKLIKLGVENNYKEVGTFYSCILSNDMEMNGMLGEQEDPPYKTYKPVKLFSVAELGIMLPTAYDTMRVVGDKAGDVWRGYDNNGKDCPAAEQVFDTEAECRAAMLIYLLGNNLITAEQINDRLSNS